MADCCIATHNILIAEESRTHTPCGENFSRLMPNLASQDVYLASTRFDKIHQKIQRRRVLRSFARANISQMQRENAKQYKILRVFFLPQVQIFAAQNRVSSTLFGYTIKHEKELIIMSANVFFHTTPQTKHNMNRRNNDQITRKKKLGNRLCR